MSATTTEMITEMIAEIAALRKHKQQIEEGLAMLGSDNPLNVIIHLKEEIREGREQSQVNFYEFQRKHEEETDSFRGEIYTLEKQLEEANGKVIELSLLQAANAELTQTVDEVKYDARRLEERLSEADSRWLPMHIALGQQNAELSELRGARIQTEKSYHLLQATNVELTQTVAKLEEELREAHHLRIFYQSECLRIKTPHELEEAKARLAELLADRDQLARSLETIRGQLDMEAYADNQRIGDLEHEVSYLMTELASKDEEFKSLSKLRDISNSSWLTKLAEYDDSIRKLVEERDVWKNRHAAVTQSAERLQSQMDEAQKRVAIAMAAIAEPPVKPVRRLLNPVAPEFAPSTPAQTLKEAVQKRMAEVTSKKEAETETMVNGFKDAIRARVAATPTLTVTEVCVSPNYKTDWIAYKEFCVSNIHSLLDECVAAKSTVSKIPVAIRLFNFVKDHVMPLLRVYKKFRLTVLAKCWEFKASEHCTAELNTVMDWVLEEFKSDHPALSPYDCGSCARCFRYLEHRITQVAQTLVTEADLAAIVLEPVAITVTPDRLTTPIKRIPVPSAPAAPEKRYRTRIRTGAIRRLNYAEESDSE